MKFLEESHPFDLAGNRSDIDLGCIPFGKNFGHILELNTLSPPMEYIGSVVIRAPARYPHTEALTPLPLKARLQLHIAMALLALNLD